MNRRKLLSFVILFFTILLSKNLFISNFALDIPLDDQWNGELMSIYKPFEEGSLSWKDLFASHNEHRIFFTRIFNLSIYILNGNRWDHVLVIRLQSILASLIPILIVFFLYRNQRIPLFSVFFFGVISSVPILYESLTIGFDNQRFFMQIFTILTISRLNTKFRFFDFILVCFFTTCAYFSMAGGIVSGIVSLGFYLSCFLFVKRDKILLLYSIILILLVSTFYFFTIKPEPHIFLKSSTFSEFLLALYTLMDYPKFGAFLIWAPLILIVIISWQKRYLHHFYIWFLVSIVFFALITSYSRGHALLLTLSNRYFETTIFSVFILCYGFDFLLESYKKTKYILLSFILFLVVTTSYFNVIMVKHDKRRELAVKNYHKYFALEKSKKGSGEQFLQSITNIEEIIYPYPTDLISFFKDQTASKILERSGLAK